MKKLDIYILKSFLKSFVLGCMAFVVIFASIQIFKIIGYIIAGKINALQGLLLFFYMMPEILLYVVPLGVLLGSLLSINKMASSLEIISLKTSGISFRRIVFFPILSALLISIFMLWFGSNVIPLANKRAREIKHNEVYNVSTSKTKTDVYIKGQRSDQGSGNFLCYVRLMDGESNILYNIEIVLMDENFTNVEKVIVARRGVFDPLLKKWTLYYADVNDPVTKNTTRYTIYEPNFLREKPDDFLRDKIRENELTTRDLKENISSLRNSGGMVRDLLVAFYKKYSFPFDAFIMVFIGLSLGSRYVRGGGASAINIGLSVVIGYSYYIMMVTFDAIALGGYISPLIASWIPNIVFLSIGLFSMRRAEF